MGKRGAKMKVTCIMCPRGCELTVTKKAKSITVTGNSCPRGLLYGEKEVTAPERMVTTIKCYNGKTITLKSASPVPKGKVFDCLKEVKKAKVPDDIKVGDILVSNVAGTGEDIIVTGISV